MFTPTSLLVLLSTLLSTTLAAPAAAPQYQSTGTISLTLIDAVGHSWPIVIPSDQSWALTNVAESISHVIINDQGSVPCVFFGVDGLAIVEFPGEVKEMDVGPPQTIVGGHCGPWMFM